GTLKGKWRYLIPAITPIHNHVFIPNYQDFKIQDFRYSDGLECFKAINIGRGFCDGEDGDRGLATLGECGGKALCDRGEEFCEEDMMNLEG
nr:hypothetical protein [Tanacetum cinerariifolium]